VKNASEQKSQAGSERWQKSSEIRLIGVIKISEILKTRISDEVFVQKCKKKLEGRQHLG